MAKMIYISLIINIVVLIPICSALLLDAGWVNDGYGPASPARGILLSIYMAILIASVFFLFGVDPKFVAALLAIQVLYKITTPFTVGTLQNPVVISNLLIAAFHVATLYTIWKAGKLTNPV